MTAGEHIQNLENKRAALAAHMIGHPEHGRRWRRDDRPGASDRTRRTRGASEIDRRRSRALARHRKDADREGRRRSRRRRSARTGMSPCMPAVDPGIKMARFVIARIAARYEGTDAVTYAEKRWNDQHAGSRARAEGRRRRGHHDRRDVGEAADQPGDHVRLPAAAAGGDDHREDRRAAQSARST